MDSKFCSVCVWILSVFITVYADLSVNCPHITEHPEEDLLILKCNVTCDDCKLRGDQWTTYVGGKKILHKNTPSSPMKKYTEFNHTVTNQSDKQSGTYEFWIQTDRGENKTNFTVTLVRKPFAEERQEAIILFQGAITSVVVIIFITVLIIIIVAYKWSVTFKSVVRECLGWSPPNSLHIDHVVYKEAVRDDCEC